jgi:putative Holliday junction resolvase
METLLGFDYGTVRVGVAVGQTITGTATPLETLRAVQQRPDWAGISRLIEAWQPDALVVGLPCGLDGSDTEISDRARRFARQLNGRYRLPVRMMDERLTSMEARSRQGPHSDDYLQRDAIAAQLILETWFSEH